MANEHEPPAQRPSVTAQANAASAPRPAVVDVPDGSRWITTPAADVFTDSLIHHPQTGDAVRVIAVRDTTTPHRTPLRQFTLAPHGSYPELVEFTVAADTVLTRLDRPYSQPAAGPANRTRPGAAATAGASRTASATQQNDRAQRLEAFHATLTEQVLSLTSSAAWTNWLRTAARFHHYSFGNTIAIWKQRPDATRVAGYRTWQSLGRQVRKGEHGIQILAPLTRRGERPDPDNTNTDPQRSDTTPPTTQAGNRPDGDPAARQIVGVRIAYVFDYAQTDGEPLPDPQATAPSLLRGQAPEHLWDGLARQVAEAGFQLTNQAPPNDANGRTEWITRRVLIRPQLDPAQRVKTLAHELGHIMLHQPQAATEPATVAACRGQREVEAESVAFLITSAHGIDSAQYTFPYVAGWATQGNDDVEATLRQSAARALTTAHRILERLDRDTPTPPIAAEDQIPAIAQPSPRRDQHPRIVTAPPRPPEPGVSR